MTRTMSCLLGILSLFAASAYANGFDRQAFDQFTSARIGDGETVYWYSVGTIRSYPDGDLIFQMEGFDAAQQHTPDRKKPYTEQYNRKIYFYKNAETGEILEEWKGEEVDAIAYPYQFITYELKGDKIETYLEQGQEPRLTKMGPSSQISARRVADTLVVSAPVFIDIPIPNTDRRIDAYEHYDFFLNAEEALAEPYQLSWVRYGDLPKWAAAESPTGKAIYHLVTWRVEDWNDIPEDLRRHVEENYPLWTAPPASLEEVRELQKPATGSKNPKGF